MFKISRIFLAREEACFAFLFGEFFLDILFRAGRILVPHEIYKSRRNLLHPARKYKQS